MKTLRSDVKRRTLLHISHDLEKGDPARAACLKIIKFIIKQPKAILLQLTFGMLRDAAGLLEEDSKILHRAVGYLAGERAKLLVTLYVYETEDFAHQLENDEIALFLKENIFNDPRSGKPVADCASMIYVLFKPNYSMFH